MGPESTVSAPNPRPGPSMCLLFPSTSLSLSLFLSSDPRGKTSHKLALTYTSVQGFQMLTQHNWTSEKTNFMMSSAGLDDPR